MAEDITIHGKIVVDTGDSASKTAAYKKEIKDLQQQMKGLEAGSKEYQAAQQKLTATTNEMNGVVAKSGGTFGGLKSALGGVIPGFEGASSGASGLGKELWALAANPIVAIIMGIVGALALLYKAFTSTNDGADKMDQIFAGIGAAINVLRDRILMIGGAIIKFFSGDFKGALEDGKKAVSGIGQEIADEFSAAAEATKVLQDLEDAMRGLSVSRAELNRDLAKAKEIMSDSDASMVDRRKAINEVRAKESEQNKKELAQAKAEYEAIKRQNALTSGTSDEALDKEAAAKVKMIDLEASSASQIRSLNRMDRQLRREAQQKADAEDKERDDRIKARKEKEQKDFEESIKKQQAILKGVKDEADMNALAFKDLEKLTADKKAKEEADRVEAQQKESNFISWQINMAAYNAESKKRIANEELAHKKAVAAEGNSIIENSINIFGKQSAVGKGLAIAQALINTYAGASEALRAKSVLPQPFDVISRIAAVASVLATGFKTVKAITSVQVPGGGGGGGGGSAPSVDVSAPVAPRQASTSLDTASIQGVGNAALGGVNRSFVLQSDINNSEERSARLNRAARLG
jgi:hypothetical protein